MLKQAFYRRMIDIYHFLAQVESIHGDVDLVVSYIEKCLSYARKLKESARDEYDEKMANAVIEMYELVLSTMRREILVEDFKEKMWELEKKYPEFFDRGHRDIGKPEESVRAIIHRIEYMVNRYDVKYPFYDMHRCNDR